MVVQRSLLRIHWFSHHRDENRSERGQDSRAVYHTLIESPSQVAWNRKAEIFGPPFYMADVFHEKPRGETVSTDTPDTVGTVECRNVSFAARPRFSLNH